jgi:hypothetical protein
MKPQPFSIYCEKFALAVTKWREVYEHRRAQSKGRAELCADYRIRVLSVDLLRDYGLADRKQAPQQWNDVPVL